MRTYIANDKNIEHQNLIAEKTRKLNTIYRGDQASLINQIDQNKFK